MTAPAFTYQEIEFRISIREGFYHYDQKVSPAYLVGDLIGYLDLHISIVVHRLPGQFRKDQWFVSERTTGCSIEIPPATSRDEAVRHAITKLQQMGNRERIEKALARTRLRKKRGESR